MIKAFKRWREKVRRGKQLKKCMAEGHLLERRGEIMPAKMVGGAPVPLDAPPEFLVFGCKCGYNEVNDVDTPAPYRRSWADAEHLKKTASVGHQITDGGANG